MKYILKSENCCFTKGKTTFSYFKISVGFAQSNPKIVFFLILKKVRFLKEIGFGVTAADDLVK